MEFKNIFTKNSNTNVTRLQLQNDDFDPTTALIEHLLVSEDTYFSIIESHLHCIHLFKKDDSIDILEEGLKDFSSSAVEFFNKLIKKLKEFFGKVFMVVQAYIGNFDKFLSKYGEKIKQANPDFNIEGFHYSFSQSIPRTDKIGNLISEYNSEMESLKTIKNSDIVAKKKEILKPQNFDNIRSYVIGADEPVRKEDYLSELKKIYRDGDEEKSPINISKATFIKTIDNYKELKKDINNVKKEKDRLILLLESMKSFFQKSAPVHYSNNVKKIHVHSMSTNNRSNGVTNGEDTLKINMTPAKLEVINKYYSLKLTETKEISGIITLAMTEKINAMKEALAFYKKIIQKSVFINNNGGES